MMLSTRMTAAVLAFAAAGFVFEARTVAAGESGTFRMLVSGITDYTTIDHAGAKITGGDLTGTVSVIRSSGGAFPEGTSYVTTCVVYAEISETATDLRGACTMTDASGDSWYALPTRKAGGIEDGGGGKGRWELSGGPGKYAGISGSCPYETKYLPGNYLISMTECSWKR